MLASIHLLSWSNEVEFVNSTCKLSFPVHFVMNGIHLCNAWSGSAVQLNTTNCVTWSLSHFTSRKCTKLYSLAETKPFRARAVHTNTHTHTHTRILTHAHVYSYFCITSTWHTVYSKEKSHLSESGRWVEIKHGLIESYKGLCGMAEYLQCGCYNSSLCTRVSGLSHMMPWQTEWSRNDGMWI